MNLADQVPEQDVEMTVEELPEQTVEAPIQFMRMMLNGQFTYLTYFILSATSFFFWLTPNCHKIRKMFMVRAPIAI